MSSESWPDAVDEILDGDHVVALAYATPAGGVVLMPVTNFGTRDRARGTVSVNSSVGVPRKLERIRDNPRVALVYHTRRHSLCERPEYVVVQGRARLSDPIADYPTTIGERWERFEPWRTASPLWRCWQRVYALRVEITVAAERILVWPDLDCRGEPTVLGGTPPRPDPESQPPPRKGTGPRLSARRVARRVARLSDSLLGWIDADGFPVAVPVTVAGAGTRGVELATAADLIPPGARRAGLVAHWFTRGHTGQLQYKHTGWLEALSGDRALYAPHTDASYLLPPSRIAYRFVSGLFTRLGLRAARRAGFVD